MMKQFADDTKISLWLSIHWKALQLVLEITTELSLEKLEIKYWRDATDKGTHNQWEDFGKRGGTNPEEMTDTNNTVKWAD